MLVPCLTCSFHGGSLDPARLYLHVAEGSSPSFVSAYSSIAANLAQTSSRQIKEGTAARIGDRLGQAA